jgi:hypothetical protein
VTAVAEAPAKKAKAAAFDLSALVPGAKVERPRRVTDKFSMVLYAPPKHGKTTLAGSCADVPELSPAIVLAAEDGTAVLANNYSDDPNLDVVNVTDWKTTSQLVMALAGVDTSKDELSFLKEPITPYKTVIVDTETEVQEQIVQAILQSEGIDKMRIQDWGTLKEKTVGMAKILHRSPHVNVIFITHSEKVKDEETGKTEIGPILLGKASYGELLKVVDIIAYLGIAKNEDGELIRVLQTQADGKFTAGDRSGNLPAQIPNPTMADVYSHFVGANK